MQVNVYHNEVTALEHGHGATFVGHFGMFVSMRNGHRWFSGISIGGSVCSALQQAIQGPQAPESYFDLLQGPCAEYVASGQCAAMMAAVNPSFVMEGDTAHYSFPHMWFVLWEA